MGKFLKRNNRQPPRRNLAKSKPNLMRKDIRMLSASKDSEKASEVPNIKDFQLPNPAGKRGGACTSTLLKILYNYQTKERRQNLTFATLLRKMSNQLRNRRQTPQLTSFNPIDVNKEFHIVPPEARGTRRAVLIGINYMNQKGELHGCQNDVVHMKDYLMVVHGFHEENIRVLMDAEAFIEPTKKNILRAYDDVLKDSRKGDSIFLHFSGHGVRVNDKINKNQKGRQKEIDGLDEAIVPVDYQRNGIIRDDELYEVLVTNLRRGVHLFSLMDCCHSGSILDLPYTLKPNTKNTTNRSIKADSMKLDENLDLDRFLDYMDRLDGDGNPAAADSDEEEIRMMYQEAREQRRRQQREPIPQ